MEGADVTVYRVKDPVVGDDRSQFDNGVLDAPAATPEVVLQADCIVMGAPGRQGRVRAEMSFSLPPGRPNAKYLSMDGFGDSDGPAVSAEKPTKSARAPAPAAPAATAGWALSASRLGGDGALSLGRGGSSRPAADDARRPRKGRG